MTPPASSAAIGGATRPAGRLPARLFLASLAVLLAGYQFLGRGFAHLAVGPVYAGEIVLAVGIVGTVATLARLRRLPALSPVLVLLLAFMALGLVDTLPYLGTYGKDALRDAVLWGYGTFALMVYILVDRPLIERAVRLYGWVLPVFAAWLPLCWYLFQIVSADIDSTRPGLVIPLVFFKAGDMAVHTAGSLAFFILLLGGWATAWSLAWRSAIAVPLLWAGYATASVNRGSMLTVVASLLALAVIRPRSRNWVTMLLGAVILVAILLPKTVEDIKTCTATPDPSATAAVVAEGRDINPCQIIENATSIVTTSDVGGLEGTKSFRLSWWTAIFDYVVRGPYFWTGKGFGINLADADGFQPTQDNSLRAPHNSHVTTLARMGVPGFALWVALQAAWVLGLLRALWRARRARDGWLAGVAGWLGVYWLAMMIDTSFDPYLEGPQGGIWFWVIFGLGMVVMRLAPSPRAAERAGAS